MAGQAGPHHPSSATDAAAPKNGTSNAHTGAGSHFGQPRHLVYWYSGTGERGAASQGFETVIGARVGMQRHQAHHPEGARQSGASVTATASEHIAFGALVDRHYAAVLRFLTRQTGDPELAADLTQACFLDAYRSRHQLLSEDAFAAWLFSIARNQLRMEWRRQRLRRLVSLDWLADRAGGALPMLRRDDQSGTLDDRDRIQQVLDELSPTLREALLLHNLCGFRGGEIADILGISADAARKRIVRAEAEFRERYEAQAPTATKASTDDNR